MSDSDSENSSENDEEVEKALPPHILRSETISLAIGAAVVVVVREAADPKNPNLAKTYDWWINDTKVPVTFKHEDELHLAVVTNLAGVRLEMKTVTVFIGKVTGKSEVTVKIGGLGRLSEMHKNNSTTLHAYFNASFGEIRICPKEFFVVKDGAAEFTYKQTQSDSNLRSKRFRRVDESDSEEEDEDQSTFRCGTHTRFIRSWGRSRIGSNSGSSSSSSQQEPEITGKFWIDVFWDHLPLQHSQSYLSRVATGMLTKEIQELDGLVQLKASNGSTVKFYKGMLAACSQKYCIEFHRERKTTKSSSSASNTTLEVRCHPNKVLSERALRAFVQFVATFTIDEPLQSPTIALQLLQAGHYNRIPEMVSSMRAILLGQPPTWFDIETSITMYSYANEMYISLTDNSNIKVREKSDWARLILRALWTLKGKTKQELQAWPGISNIFPNDASIDLFAATLALI